MLVLFADDAVIIVIFNTHYESDEEWVTVPCLNYWKLLLVRFHHYRLNQLARLARTENNSLYASLEGEYTLDWSALGN